MDAFKDHDIYSDLDLMNLFEIRKIMTVNRKKLSDMYCHLTESTHCFDTLTINSTAGTGQITISYSEDSGYDEKEYLLGNTDSMMQSRERKQMQLKYRKNTKPFVNNTYGIKRLMNLFFYLKN